MFEFRRATVADSAVIAAMEKEYIECAWSENTVREALSDADTAVYLLIVNGETVGYGGLKTVFETAEILYSQSFANMPLIQAREKFFWK